MAEVIEIAPKTGKEKKSATAGPIVEAEDDSDSESEGDKDNAPDGADKAAKKKQMKQEKRDKRKLKKELKLAFKSQNTKLIKQTTADIGSLRVGVSVKKIY